MSFFLYSALGVLFFMPFNLMQIQDYSEFEAGLSMLPLSICMILISPYMGKFVTNNGLLIPLTVGPLITGIGFISFSVIGITTGIIDYWHTFFISFMLLGIGLSITVAPLTTAVMGDIPENNIGVASGVNDMIYRASGLIAVTVFGAFSLIYFQNYIIKELDVYEVSEHLKLEIIHEISHYTAARVPKDASLVEVDFI